MKPGRTSPVIGLIGGLTAVFLLLPLLAVIPVSFTPQRYLSLPDGAWSTRHYQALLTEPAWAESILLSLKVGLLSATLAILLALAFALGLWMMRPRFGGVLAGGGDSLTAAGFILDDDGLGLNIAVVVALSVWERLGIPGDTPLEELA